MFFKFCLSGGAHSLGHSDCPNVWASSLSDPSYSGHNDLNENQTTPLLSGVNCWGHSDLMWLPKEPPPLRNHSTFESTLVIFHPLGCAQPVITLHTPSIPSQGIHLPLHRKDRYQVSIAPVIAKALFMYVHTYPSKSDLFSILVLSHSK